jgi:lipopolysaccharide assembly outer membrane protein LptD (OstA)
MRTFTISRALGLALLGTGLLLAAPRGPAPARAADQPAPTPKPEGSAAQPEKKAKKVQIKHADKLYYDAGQKVYHLTGNIVMVQEDVTMTMDQCDYDDKNNSAVATGHLRVVDPESTLTGDSLKVAFDPKFAQIIGNVTIVTQKKKKEESKATQPATEGAAPPAAQPAEGDKKGLSQYREKKTTITCPQIDYYYADDKKQAVVYGPLKAVQEDKTVYADKAFYDGVKDEVTLEGNVRILTEGGSEFRCPSATISLKDDWIQAVNVEGVAVEEKKPEEKKPKEAKPAATTEGGGGATPAPAPAPSSGS